MKAYWWGSAKVYNADEVDAAIVRLRESQRSAAQRPEAWLLRDILAQRRALARLWISRSTATPDRPALVGLAPVGRVAGSVPLTGRAACPATSPERRP